MTDAPTPCELAHRVDEIAQALMVANVGDNQSVSDLAWQQARDDVLSSPWFTEHVIKALAGYAAMFATHVERLHAQQTRRPFTEGEVVRLIRGHPIGYRDPDA